MSVIRLFPCVRGKFRKFFHRSILPRKYDIRGSVCSFPQFATNRNCSVRVYLKAISLCIEKLHLVSPFCLSFKKKKKKKKEFDFACGEFDSWLEVFSRGVRNARSCEYHRGMTLMLNVIDLSRQWNWNLFRLMWPIFAYRMKSRGFCV